MYGLFLLDNLSDVLFIIKYIDIETKLSFIENKYSTDEYELVQQDWAQGSSSHAGVQP